MLRLGEMRISTFAQFAALCLAVAAIIWSLALAEWVLFPSVSGEWTALAAPTSYIVNTSLASSLLRQES